MRFTLRTASVTTSAPVVIAASALAQLSVNDQTVLEGNSGTTPATFTVSLASPSCRTVLVQVVTADGTATAGLDYQAIQTNLVFSPGEVQKTVTVLVLRPSRLVA